MDMIPGTDNDSSTCRTKCSFQADVDKWMDACFGEPIKSDQLERADRFTEEALELAQTATGFTKDRAHALVDYVFDRPQGEINQEVGGVMVTLAALCNTAGVNIADAAETELTRIGTKVEAIRAKQASKPTGSALPTAPASTQCSGDTQELADELEAAYDRCKLWPERTGDGQMALLELRNLAPAILSALRTTHSSAEVPEGDYNPAEIEFLQSLLDRYSENGGIIPLADDHAAFMRIVRKNLPALSLPVELLDSHLGEMK